MAGFPLEIPEISKMVTPRVTSMLKVALDRVDISKKTELSISEISQKFIVGVALSEFHIGHHLSIKSIFGNSVSCDQKVKTMKFHNFLAHLEPKVLLVFAIGKISPSSICSLSNLVFCCFITGFW